MMCIDSNLNFCCSTDTIELRLHVTERLCNKAIVMIKGLLLCLNIQLNNNYGASINYNN